MFQLATTQSIFYTLSRCKIYNSYFGAIHHFLKHVALINLVSSNVQHKINLQVMSFKILMRHVIDCFKGAIIPSSIDKELDNHMHTYLGTIVIMSMIEDDLTKVHTLVASFPSTITLPIYVPTINHILESKTSLGLYDHCSHIMITYGHEMCTKRKMNYAKRFVPMFTKISWLMFFIPCKMNDWIMVLL